MNRILNNQDPVLQRLQDQVRTAQNQGTALQLRGGGTKAFYGGLPRGELLDLRPLSGISSYEPSELVITALAGTPLAEVEAALAQKGQCLAFEPPRFLACVDGAGAGSSTAIAAQAASETAASGGTVGGMVCSGLAGPSRASVGGVRDYVLGVTLLNGSAELLSFGGQVIKNVAGYDVSRLLTGSMGVLGVVCEVSLKVLPVAAASQTLCFEWDQAQALLSLNQWAGQAIPLNASVWHQGRLSLRLRGAAAAVAASARLLGGHTLEAGLADRFWDSLRDQRHAFFGLTKGELETGERLWRLSLPSTAAPLVLEGEQLIEWGGAQRWWRTRVPATQVRELARGAGGHATLFRAADKTIGVFEPLDAPLMRIHRELKKAFDPAGVFNPGRLYADL